MKERPVHHVPPAAFVGKSLRFAFAMCGRKVIRSYTTDAVDQVTCTACLATLSQDTVDRMKNPEPSWRRWALR